MDAGYRRDNESVYSFAYCDCRSKLCREYSERIVSVLGCGIPTRDTRNCDKPDSEMDLREQNRRNVARAWEDCKEYKRTFSEV